MFDYVTVASQYQIDVATGRRILNQDYIFCVIASYLFFREQAAHPPVWKGAAEPLGKIVIDL